MLVVDISCDVNGSVEFLERTTNIDRPYFQYDPIVNSEVSEFISSDGVTVMGVDILPTELPRESSAFFGDALLPVLEKFVASKTEGNDSSAVPSELVSAGTPLLRNRYYTGAHCVSFLDERLHCLRRLIDAKLPAFGELLETAIWNCAACGIKGDIVAGGESFATYRRVTYSALSPFSLRRILYHLGSSL